MVIVLLRFSMVVYNVHPSVINTIEFMPGFCFICLMQKQQVFPIVDLQQYIGAELFLRIIL